MHVAACFRLVSPFNFQQEQQERMFKMIPSSLKLWLAKGLVLQGSEVHFVM